MREEIAITTEDESPAPAIAIVGMSGRFPGAASLEEFWQNLAAGIDSVSSFRKEEMEVNRATSSQPGYIGARSILPDVDKFDPAFFGIYPKEAEQMDPQHRIFLECAWEALERAGHGPEKYPGMIGVFAGCSMNTYFMHNLARDRAYLAKFAEGYQSAGYTTMLGNDKDFLPTRVSYKLNLRGPSLSVQTACSTSLVAIAQACQSLLTYGCDMALAGGVSITFPQRRGYVAEEGGILSTDGTIHPFDKNAKGTVFGHGAGVVLLKRLDDARADRDSILAVIRGFALNNDGGHRAGYTAPSQEGQAEVIALAQAMAGFDPSTITYVEAHGTGTALGDPVEVAGLTRAFRAGTDRKHYCVLGTAKANIGHLDVASGVVGLIKAVENFNPDVRTPFEAYAWLLIVGELMHYVRDHERIVRLPRPLRGLEKQFARAHDTLGARLGRSPSASELAAELDLDLTVVDELRSLRRGGCVVSIEAVTGSPTGELAAALRGLALEERLALQLALEHLAERERIVVLGSFAAGLSQAELGARLGLSQSQVSKMIKKALLKMQRQVA